MRCAALRRADLQRQTPWQIAGVATDLHVSPRNHDTFFTSRNIFS